MSLSNPYWHKSFFAFLKLFLSRMGDLASGKLAFSELAVDEVQLFLLGAIGVSCALIGTFLVLKKQTMLANALSHTVLLGIVIAYVLLGLVSSYTFASFPVLLLAALISALLTVFFTQVFTHVMRLQEDASIGLVFSFLFAIGIIFASVLTKNVHIGIEVVMGNVDIVQLADLRLALSLVGFNLLIIALFHRQYTLTVFDKSLARSYGVPVKFFEYLMMFQTAITVIGSFRAVGVLLVLAFLVSPVVIARLFTNKVATLLGLSCLIGLGISVIGVAISRHILSVYQLPLSTSGVVVSLFVVVFIISACIHLNKKYFYQLVKKQKTAKPQAELSNS